MEKILKVLEEPRDLVLLYSLSGGMVSFTDTPTEQSRLDYGWGYLQAMVTLMMEHDPDGPTVIPFSDHFSIYDHAKPRVLNQIKRDFKAGGRMLLAPPLQSVFDRYTSLKRDKKLKKGGMSVFCFSHGLMDDVAEAREAIVSFANNSIESTEEADTMFGLTFLHVGSDRQAISQLEKFDDDLKLYTGGKDIVDHKAVDWMFKVGFAHLVNENLRG